MAFTAVGCYIFAGGFTVGVKKHFDVLAHLEGDNYGVSSAQKNFPGLPIHVGRESWPIEALRKKRIDFAYGNPPCAAWSALNGQKTTTGTWRKDERVGCTRNHFSNLEGLRPHFWAWESVARAFSVGRPFVDELTAQALNLGYSVSYLLIDAQYLGAPQRRHRFFFVAHDVPFEPRMPTFDRIITAGQALKGIRPCKNFSKFDPMITKACLETQPGGHIVDTWDRLVPKAKRTLREVNGRTVTAGRPAFRYMKLDPKEVSPTIVGNSIIHHKDPRTLSTAEIRALGGYPADFIVDAKAAPSQADLLARAVLPPVGEWLAGEVAHALQTAGRRRIKKPTVTLYQYDKAPGRVQAIEFEEKAPWLQS